jgi:hypothetical protein
MRTCSSHAGLLLAAGLLLGGSAWAGNKSYHECQITNGRVFSCDGAWYQGKAVVLRDGSYHLCQITNGRVFSCDGAWYQGKAVIQTDR